MLDLFLEKAFISIFRTKAIVIQNIIRSWSRFIFVFHYLDKPKVSWKSNKTYFCIMHLLFLTLVSFAVSELRYPIYVCKYLSSTLIFLSRFIFVPSNSKKKHQKLIAKQTKIGIADLKRF